MHRIQNRMPRPLCDFPLRLWCKKTRLKLNIKRSIQESGTVTTNDMAKEHKFGQMGLNMKGIGKMTRQMDKVNYSMETARLIRDFG